MVSGQKNSRRLKLAHVYKIKYIYIYIYIYTHVLDNNALVQVNCPELENQTLLSKLAPFNLKGLPAKQIILTVLHILDPPPPHLPSPSLASNPLTFVYKIDYGLVCVYRSSV